MRSYRQYCGLARALDVVGDRWTLLIVRELLIRGSAMQYVYRFENETVKVFESTEI